MSKFIQWKDREPINPNFSSSHPAAGVVVMGAPSDMPSAKRSTKHQDVLRMSVIKQYVSGGGNHLPSMLVNTRGGKWGPTSNRMSKGKHKRSGSATGRTPDGKGKQANLCHYCGPGRNLKIYDKIAKQELARDMARLRLMSARRCSNPAKYDRPQDREDYVTLWKKVILLHPNKASQIERFEAAHEARYAN